MTDIDYVNEESILVVPIAEVQKWFDKKSDEWLVDYFKEDNNEGKWWDERHKIHYLRQDMEEIYKLYAYSDNDASSEKSKKINSNMHYYIANYVKTNFETLCLYKFKIKNFEKLYNWYQIILKDIKELKDIKDEDINPFEIPALKIYFYNELINIIFGKSPYNPKTSIWTIAETLNYYKVKKLIEERQKIDNRKRSINQVLTTLSASYADYIPVGAEVIDYANKLAAEYFATNFSPDNPQAYVDYILTEHKKLEESTIKAISGSTHYYIMALAKNYPI